MVECETLDLKVCGLNQIDADVSLSKTHELPKALIDSHDLT